MLLYSLLGAFLLFKSVTCEPAQVSFNNQIRFLFDTDGNQIDAYGSKIQLFDGKYYLYGNSFSLTGVAFGIKSYSSVDLVNWAYEGFLYDPYSTTPCDQTGGCGRPHILYSQKSEQYVLWADAGSSGYIVATSSSPSTGFVFSNETAAIDPKFDGLQPADFSVESFGDKAYLVFSVLNFEFSGAGNIWPEIQQTIHISELTDDFMNTTQVSYNVTSSNFDLVDQEVESPDLFVRNGTFYVAASNSCAYCDGSIGLLYRSDSIEGPWTRQIISAYSCNGQVEGVLTLVDPTTNETSYIWHSTSVPGGPRIGFAGHIFQPLEFQDDGSAADLNCSSEARFSVAFTAGTGSKTESVISSTDASPAIAPYHSVCDSDVFNLFQTWTVENTGTLKSLSINIAKSVQTVALVVKVFKFSNITELLSAEYKYTLLGTSTINSTELSYVFNTTSVLTNANVTAGDRLGFSIAGSDYAPYCHLEYDLESGSDHMLYQQGVGQTSPRGMDGKTGPLKLRTGKGIKFFTTFL
jgi:hypothetical protein